MSQCPRCQNKLQEEFGLTTCEQCGAALFVEFDGIVKVAEDEEGQDTAGDLHVQLSAEDVRQVPVEIDVVVPAEIEAPPEIETEMNLEAESSAQPLEEVFEGSFYRSMPEDVPAGDMVIGDPATTIEPAILAMPEPEEAVVPSDGPVDITAYANSVESQGREGMLKYDVFISGIDTADIRYELKEAMIDSRFVWDAESLLKTIREGRLTLKGLPAVKAAVLVNRIKYLPVKISWKQYAINQ